MQRCLEMAVFVLSTSQMLRIHPSLPSFAERYSFGIFTRQLKY